MENGINKAELREAINGIINESLQNDMCENYDGTKVFNIRRYVSGLIEEGHKNPRLMSYLMRFDESIKRGAKEFMLFEQFGKGLEEFAKGNKQIKSILESMNETKREHGNTLEGFKIIEQIPDEYTRDTIRECFNEFLGDPCDETKLNLIESLDNLYGMNENLAMSFQLIIEGAQAANPQFFKTQFMNESKQVTLDKKLEENRKEKYAQDIFKKVEKYLNEKFDSEEIRQQHENEKYSLAGIANNNGLNLYERLNTVLKSDAIKNVALRNVILQYTDAIAHGAYEERLYETLLQNTSKFDYLLPVDKMRKQIMEAVENNRESITLTKLLEMMKDSAQSYIYVELIQEDVARYVENPNPTNRVQLRNALMPYASDPYINEMFNIIYSDDSINANSITEKAMSIKDQLNIIKENASVTSIYSPVQYIRDNESIFNVHGQYYIKRGDNIATLDKKFIPKLDEKFVELCHLVNDPHVQILEDKIILSGADNYATIYEGYVDIAGYRESAETLRNLNEMYMKYENYDTNFYIMCSCLLENFNNIAKVDFAKHVTLNENSDITADLFKVNESIYLTTHNNALMKHVFYCNVNPISLRNKLNEHMGINVASLFEDLLPNQSKIILQLNETKSEYETSIAKYEDMIQQLTDAKKESATDEMTDELSKAIEDAKKELADIKDEYKKWQKETEDAIDADSTDEKDDTEDVADDPNTKVETSNVPLDADEVDQYKDELSTRISAGADAPAEDDPLTDDEFSDMLATEGEPENPDDTEIDTDEIDNAPVVADEDDVFVMPEEDEEDDEAFTMVDTDAISSGDEAADDDTEDIFADDEVATDVPAEEISDDEDIITTDDEDIYDDGTEPVKGDIQTVDAETGEIDGSEATDIFGGDVEDPMGDDSTADTDLYNPHAETSEFNIVNVMFDGNVTDGTVNKSGEVLVLRPMVDATGKKFVESVKIHFYLNADNNPVIQSDEAMSSAMYNAIVSSIKSHPQYSDVCANGISTVETTPAVDVASVAPADDFKWEDEYAEDGNDEDKDIFDIAPDTLVDVDDDVIDTDVIDSTPTVDDYVEAEIETPEVDTVATEVVPETPAEDEDEFGFGEIFGIDDEDSESDDVVADVPVDTEEIEVVADPVQTYTDEEGTEIEVPAPEATEEPVLGDVADEEDEDMGDLTDDDLELDIEDDEESVIPESVQHRTTQKSVNENRKSILSVKKNK